MRHNPEEPPNVSYVSVCVGSKLTRQREKILRNVKVKSKERLVC